MFKKKDKKETAKTQVTNKIKEDRKYILNPKSSFYLREAYKTLRTNVNFALADTEGCKTILVTSGNQSEGKSLTALNLAISLSQTDYKVLIVDCDMRRPKLNRLLNISNTSGLSNLLMDSSQMDATIVSHETYGIDFLLSGDIPPNPSELLASARMQKLLTALRERYDYIIIDSPPVNMVIDAVVLSEMCDGVLFVVKAEQSERGAVIHAIDQLEYAKAKILGFLFNGVSPDTGIGYGKYRYRQYGRYGRYGRYGYGKYGYGKYGYGYGYGYSSHSYSSYPHTNQTNAAEMMQNPPMSPNPPMPETMNNRL